MMHGPLLVVETSRDDARRLLGLRAELLCVQMCLVGAPHSRLTVGLCKVS